MFFKRGSYTGDGNAGGQAITGLGFQPRIVIVRRDNATNAATVRIEGMTANNGKPLTGANAITTTGVIKSLDVDGFTLSDNNANVNQNATTYMYVAIGGEGANFAYGTYAGNAADNRDITCGFAPDLVLIVPEGAVRCPWRTSDFTGDDSMNFTQAHTTNLIQGFGSTTFQVGTGMNASGTTYDWIAVKKVSGVFNTFTYTGNGSDNRSITGAGFQPTFALTQSDAGAAAIIRHASVHSGDESVTIDASAADAANKIQNFVSDGIEVGTDASVNSNAVKYYGFAFLDVAPATVAQTYRSIQRSIDPADWDGTVTGYLEVHAKTDNAVHTLTAYLYNVTDAAQVTGSDVTITATSVTRARSSSFSFASGAKTYEVRYGGVEGGDYTMEDAAVIVDVT